MFLERVTKVAVGSRQNPARPKSRKKAKAPSSNPAHLLSLGWINPKVTKGSNMAKAKRAAPKASQNRKGKKKASNPGTKIVVIGPKQNKGGQYTVRKKSRNPTFFGSNVSGMQMAQYVGAGLAGLTVNRLALPMLPDMFRQSPIAVSLSALALAGVEWWLASMASKELGAAVGFGALMGAGSVMLNQVVPSVGRNVPISGRRGTGDFVGADRSAFLTSLGPDIASVPGNGVAMRSAYPAAYGMAA